jgi:hypothetical protein
MRPIIADVDQFVRGHALRGAAEAVTECES